MTLAASPPTAFSLFADAIKAEGVNFRLTHQVEVNTMIDQVILPRFHPLRRTEIHPVLFTHIPHGLPRARQPDDPRVEFLQVALQHGRRVPGWVAGDEEGKERLARGDGVRGSVVVGGFRDRVAARGGRGYEVDDLCELVELFRADVWTVCEAKVYLGGHGAMG